MDLDFWSNQITMAEEGIEALDISIDSLATAATAERDRILRNDAARISCPLRAQDIDFLYRMLLAHNANSFELKPFVMGRPADAGVSLDLVYSGTQRAVVLQDTRILQSLSAIYGLTISEGGAINAFDKHSEALALHILRESRVQHAVNHATVHMIRDSLFSTCHAEMAAGTKKPMPTTLLEHLMRPRQLSHEERRRQEREQSEAHHELNRVDGAVGAQAKAEDLLPTRQMKQLFRRGGAIAENNGAIQQLQRIAVDDVITPLVSTATLLCLQEVTADDGEGFVPAITVNDVLVSIPSALPSSNISVYGFGAPGDVRVLLGDTLITVLKQIHPSLSMDEVALSVLHDMIVKVLVDVALMARQVTLLCGRRAGEAVSFVKLRSVVGGALQREVCSDEHVMVTTASDVETAITTVLKKELAKAALGKCKTVVRSVDLSKGSELPQWLNVSPDMILYVLQAQPSTSGVINLSLDALVFLMSVVQYVCDEVLELSGNGCLDYGVSSLTSRHIMMAVRNDEELNRLFPGVFRDGGVLPNINGALILRASDRSSLDRLHVWTKLLCDECNGANVNVVHPLTGELVHVEYNADEREHILRRSPVLNNAVPVVTTSEFDRRDGPAQRQLRVMQSLPAEVAAELTAICQSPAVAWEHALREVRAAQATRLPAFDIESIHLLCQQTIRRQTTRAVAMTSEAVELIRCVLEHYLVDMIENANVGAILLGKRKSIEENDVAYVKRVRR